MNIYKEASKQHLRIATKKGPLSVEQLWGLSLNELDTLAVSLEEEYQNSGRKSFITKESDKSICAKLRFDIVVDILKTKMEAEELSRQKTEIRDHNRRIDELILRKKNQELENMSVEELENLRK